MPLFVCDACRGIENTALGFYHGKENYFIKWKDPNLNGKAFCSECIPAEMENGKIYEDHTGVWHGQFPKEIATEATVRAWGLWPHPPNGLHGGLIYLGPFEHLRPELENEKRAALQKK